MTSYILSAAAGWYSAFSTGAKQTTLNVTEIEDRTLTTIGL